MDDVVESAVAIPAQESKGKIKSVVDTVRDKWAHRGERKLPIELSFDLDDNTEFHTDFYVLMQPVKLSDGTVIREGDVVGKIDIKPAEQLPTGPEGEVRKPEYSLKLMRSVQNSLVELAKRCQEDPQLRQVKAFGGYSLLARLGPRFGFETFPILDNQHREHFLKESFDTAKHYSNESTDIDILNKPFQQAWISPYQLMQRYLPKDQR